MAAERIFLHEGSWYVTVPCPVHGQADEEVPWDEAKTPYTAAGIAQARHGDCIEEFSRETVKESRKAEIEAAKREVERIEALIPQAEAEFEERMEDADRLNGIANERREARAAEGRLDSDKPDKADHDARIATAMMQQAEERLASYRDGLKQAKKRLAETRKQNSTKLPK